MNNPKNGRKILNEDSAERVNQDKVQQLRQIIRQQTPQKPKENQ